MTVEKLFNELKALVEKGQGNKKIILADDVEGNGFHGCFYSVISDPEKVSDNINASNGLCDTDTTNYDNLVIIG